MGDRPDTADEGRGEKSNERDELRAMSFRLREIQRLLAARVAQENRRLEAEGLEPVTDHDAFDVFVRDRDGDGPSR